MLKLVLATNNKGKVSEMRHLLRELPIIIVTSEEVGIYEDIEETGTTFQQNALIKARQIHDLTGKMVLADDSGLEIDYLGGKPGVYSKRFAGDNASDTDRIKKVLELMSGVQMEKRTARFVCAIAVILEDGNEYVIKETCEGYISFEPDGVNGFGYDSIFIPVENSKTFAMLSIEEKQLISHRGKALRKAQQLLNN